MRASAIGGGRAGAVPAHGALMTGGGLAACCRQVGAPRRGNGGGAG